MTRREPNLLSMILVPAIISNIITLLRLVLELKGAGPVSHPGQLTWWVSVSLLIPLAGLYFAYLLRDSQQPFRRLAATLLMYGFSVRIPTAILYGISGALHWNTHYSHYGPGVGGYLLGGLLPQLVLWPIITVIGGSLVGMPFLILLRYGRGKTVKPASI